MAFCSKKHSSTEANYEIYDKDLMTIVQTFNKWPAELESVENSIQVLSDHKNLEYFMANKNISRQQVQWVEYLSRFSFQISYQPEKKNANQKILTTQSRDFLS